MKEIIKNNTDIEYMPETDEKQESLIDLYNDIFEKRIIEEEKEIEVLVDKFEIHTKGKEILLENSRL
ncbi:MAG TPA: hypothetical protein PLG05_09745 [Bacteroidales bacterium]|nr:hypothetical protein [Bacteroidales bacterium]HOR61041.1 hypothetical protein [Bacteroidales bacterium]HPL05445.1 hypothetical protein [Bacteroidales bacterium]